MKRSHRIALKPTPEQESLFGQHAGYARFAYNWALGEFKAGLDVGEWLSERTLRPRWNKVKHFVAPWAASLSQNPAKYSIIDLGQAADAWGAFRRSVKAGKRPGRRVGFPRFKRRKHEQGFRADNGPDTVRVDGKTVLLPRIGRVAMVEELRFGGSIREATINRTAGQWFASFCVEDGQPAPAGEDRPDHRSGRRCWHPGGVLQRTAGGESESAKRRDSPVAPGGQGDSQVKDRARQVEPQQPARAPVHQAPEDSR